MNDPFPNLATQTAGSPTQLRGLPTQLGRTLPHSIEAEEFLLSCCLIDGQETMARCATARLAPESFYDPKHGIVFRHLLALHKRQMPTDCAVLAEELKSAGELDQVGGYAFVTQISNRVPTTAQAAYFIDQVRIHWIRRELIKYSRQLLEDAYQLETPLLDLLSPKVAWLQTALSRVAHATSGAVTLAQRISDVEADVEKRFSGTEDRSGWIHTGLASFDRNQLPLGSDAEDHIVLLGGGSGHGKSALGRQIAGAALQAGKRVLNYTIETGCNGWIRQVASNWARVDLTTLGEAPKDHLARFKDASERLRAMADKNLFVFQHEVGCPMKTVEDLAQHARTWSWQHGTPHLVVVDYLQLLGTKKRCNNREQEVAHVSHELQTLQRELRCVVLILAQYNETGLREMRTGRRDDKGKLLHRLPNAGDFRESQAMYHDADRVIGLYRPPEDCRGNEQNSGVSMPEQWVCQIKRRYGREGFQRCWFEKRFLNFKEFSSAESTASAVAEAAATGAVVKGGMTKAQWKNPRS